MQYEDPTGELMMLPTDMALVWDRKVRTLGLLRPGQVRRGTAAALWTTAHALSSHQQALQEAAHCLVHNSGW